MTEGLQQQSRRDPKTEEWDQISDEDKLKAIQEEFGDIASLVVNRETGEN